MIIIKDNEFHNPFDQPIFCLSDVSEVFLQFIFKFYNKIQVLQ